MMFGATKEPKAVGLVPTGMGEPTTVLVAVFITDTVLPPKLAT
jgi:hypothetical protein